MSAQAYVDSLGPNHRFAEDYVLIRELGRGGFGVVFEAENERLGRGNVALKILFPNASAEAIRRFRLENAIVARTYHENLLEAYVEGSEPRDGQNIEFCAMQLVGGGNLAQYQAEQPDGVLAPQQIVTILCQVCNGLMHVHALGIVHRDLKPPNILIDRQAGQVYLSDFGLAKTNSSFAGTEPGVPMGTPDYMSPEQQANSHGVDARSDLYSLGVTLHEMVCGRPRPRDSANIVNRLGGTREANKLAQIYQFLCDPNPARRFQNAGIVSNALAQVMRPNRRCIISQQEVVPDRDVNHPEGGGLWSWARQLLRGRRT